MARPSEQTLEARVQRLEKRKQAMDARLSQEKAKLRDKQRRVREAGELVELANLAHVDKAVLLGALLEVASRSQDASVRQGWQQQGQALLAKQSTKPGVRTRSRTDRDAWDPALTVS